MTAELSNLQWGLRFFASECGSSLTAEVTYKKKVVCRLSHLAGNMTPEEVREVLLSKALVWIADYQRRDHSGDTVVGDLMD
ncbi:hypothetical protein QTH89_14615 [Variovorax sp. J22G21]|uniref:hypothetical protein n=1 Tax=Variovorax fucosicus TaxID=3053517 RepID=UPI0025769841|nr:MULTISPECIES: hypothetical protein [unclassified Variovorax]MDM0037655.1 hypothetical protein [Variovorax sp. J22R193]MDM0056679.1 hypothetical protein [Variovorax sp. J22G47]MDM0062431.1 hypothetical protein [Variovorax sp. J22G21]